MFKLLTITFNLLALIIFGVFFEDVSVEQDLPDNVELGNEFVVTVTIQKDDFDGYAKYQVELPSGVTAKYVDKGTAKFKFEDHKAKFIWMNLPKEESFKVSYRVIVNDKSLKEVPVSGTFSYLSDNQRMTVDVMTKTVVIGPLDKPATPQANAVVSVTRDIQNIENDLYQVNLKIKYTDVRGFAKIQDIIPAGASVKPVEAGGSVFSIVNTKVKYVWMNFPEDDGEINVSYRIDLANAKSKNINDLAGEFAYIEGDESKKVMIGNPSGVDLVASTEPAKTEVKKETKKEKKSIPVTNTPAPQNGVVYKVQIMAAHKSVNVNSYFSSKFKFNENVEIDLHEGWSKYLTGEYGKYLEARNKRNNIRSSYNFRGPFVVAYNDGERITVQEALMITRQKWVN